MMSWIDDNAIVGKESDVMDLKKALMDQFECEDCGPMEIVIVMLIVVGVISTPCLESRLGES